MAQAMLSLMASLNGRSGVRGVGALSGREDLTFESLPRTSLAVRANRVIRAAVHGVSLRQLPASSKTRLACSRAGRCDEIAVFLEMMEVLFPRREQEGDDDDDDGGEQSRLR